MAVEYYLICNTSKEFIRLHKLRLFPDEPYPLPVDGMPVDEQAVRAACKAFRDTFPGEIPGWISSLEPYLETFLNDHSTHDLVMKDDHPDPAWYPETAGYTAWKERQTPLTNELFLPRNVVDDLRITDWKEAEAYLKKSHVVLFEELELNEYRRAFDELIQKCQT